jgi:hypothetical protein
MPTGVGKRSINAPETRPVVLASTAAAATEAVEAGCRALAR